MAEPDLPELSTEEVLLEKIEDQTNEIADLKTKNKNMIYGLAGLGIMFIGVLIWALSANS